MHIEKYLKIISVNRQNHCARYSNVEICYYNAKPIKNRKQMAQKIKYFLFNIIQVIETLPPTFTCDNAKQSLFYNITSRFTFQNMQIWNKTLRTLQDNGEA